MVTLTCFVKMTSIFFQAVGQPVKAAAASLIRDLLCFVPLAFILPEFMGIDGVLYAAPIADVIAAAIAVTLSVVFFKKLKKQEKELLNKKQACDTRQIKKKSAPPNPPLRTQYYYDFY